MNQLVQTLKLIVQFLENHKIPYMVFGGIANSIYGNPRQTFDIDIKVNIQGEESLSNFIENSSKVSTILVKNPHEFIQETGVLPIKMKDVRIDIVFANLPYELEAIEKSIKKEIFGIKASITRPEDLIIQKAISQRDKDWMDIKGVIENQKKDLDWDYIIKHAKELGAFLADPSIYQKLIDLKDA
jgi:predicted nucleotidyltransferase